jgi:xanthine/uracil/vitamin C permease (AzgA family)
VRTNGESTERKWLRFPVAARGSTYSREFVAGLSMFLATAYTVVVIPGMLSDAGLPVGAVTTSVIIVVILGTAAMGIFGNLPMVLAPGLGGVSLVAYTLVLDGDVSYPVAMGMVLWSGVIFLLLTLFGIRSLITRIIPHSIRLAIGPAIGVFIAFVGFRSAGLVRPGESSLELGDLYQLCGIGHVGRRRRPRGAQRPKGSWQLHHRHHRRDARWHSIGPDPSRGLALSRCRLSTVRSSCTST